MVDNYSLFEEQIRKTPLSLEQILAGIEKLVIVDISLERDHDNPQLIFESLNSTGLDLSQADLIRNYVLMGQPPKQQAEIYTKSWFPLEQSFPDEPPGAVRPLHARLPDDEDRPDPEASTRSTRASRRSRRPSELTIAELVADVYHHSKHWVKLAFGRTEDQALREALADLNQLKVDVAFPFLMDVLDDYEQGKITARRADRGRPPRRELRLPPRHRRHPDQHPQQDFAALAREVDEANYMESLKAALLLKESYARMPGDEEFRREFVVKDVYNFRSRNYLLRKLENHDRKERVDVDSYTIEHVMPQNPDLSPEWQDELGPGLADGAGAVPAHDRQPDPHRLQLGAERPPVQREADDEGRLPGQPAPAERLPGQARALERTGDRAARRAPCRPRSASLAGAEPAGGDARQVPDEQGQARRRLHPRRPPGAEGRDRARLRRSCASAC